MVSRMFIIAEAGVNHNGSLERALEMVRTAAECGADAVKFQTFRAEALVAASAPMAEYQKTNTGTDRSQLDMLRELELSTADFSAIRDECQRASIEFMSTPFDEVSADELDALGMQTWKIPSGELTNIELIQHVAKKRGRVILSTGMGTMDEVSDAIGWVRSAGQNDLWVLQCVSAYPAPFADLNLRAMHTMATAFGVRAGLSDHSLGIEAGIASAALGACCVEKHFTLSRQLPGPDHAASLEPSELQTMILSIRNIEAAMGSGEKLRTASEADTALVARRSWTLGEPVDADTPLTRSHLRLLRPGTGIAPKNLDSIVGKRLVAPRPAGHVLTEEDLR